MRRFSELLKEYRLAKEMTQGELARRVQVDNSYITRLEKGQRIPPYEKVGRLKEALGLGEDETEKFFVSAGYMPPHMTKGGDEVDLADPALKIATFLLARDDLTDSEREILRKELSHTIRYVWEYRLGRDPAEIDKLDAEVK